MDCGGDGHCDAFVVLHGVGDGVGEVFASFASVDGVGDCVLASGDGDGEVGSAVGVFVVPGVEGLVGGVEEGVDGEVGVVVGLALHGVEAVFEAGEVGVHA